MHRFKKLNRGRGRTFCFRIGARDPLTLIAVAALLATAAATACDVPERRATKVDPIVALRYE